MWVSPFLIATHATITQWRLWNLVQLRNDQVDDEVEFEIKWDLPVSWSLIVILRVINREWRSCTPAHFNYK
jgi:hypothetical protein